MTKNPREGSTLSVVLPMLNSVPAEHRGEMMEQVRTALTEAMMDAEPFGEVSASPLETFHSLAALGIVHDLPELAMTSLEERQAAVRWALSVLASEAGDTTVDIPARLLWIHPRNTLQMETRIQEAIERAGGFAVAQRLYHDEWREKPTLTFGERLLELEDEDLYDDLESVGITADRSPDSYDNARLIAFIDRLLRSAASDDKQIAMLKDAERTEIAMVRSHYDRQRSPIQLRKERTLKFATDLGQFLEYGKRKSMKMVYGSVGRTDYKEQTVVTSEPAALEWAEKNKPEFYHTVEHKILHTPALVAYAKVSGEVIPGVEDVPARTEWWARVKPPEPKVGTDAAAPPRTAPAPTGNAENGDSSNGNDSITNS